MNDYCLYYQAHIPKHHVLLLVSILKSFDHLCFDRSVDMKQNLFEFFVPKSNQEMFGALMQYFQQKGMVTDLREVSNRLMDEDVRC